MHPHGRSPASTTWRALLVWMRIKSRGAFAKARLPFAGDGTSHALALFWQRETFRMIDPIACAIDHDHDRLAKKNERARELFHFAGGGGIVLRYDWGYFLVISEPTC